jgi:hypothetical protein
MSASYYEKYYELLNTIITYKNLEQKLSYFEEYSKQLKYQNKLLRIDVDYAIGETELQIALAKAIICQNSDILADKNQ